MRNEQIKQDETALDGSLRYEGSRNGENNIGSSTEDGVFPAVLCLFMALSVISIIISHLMEQKETREIVGSFIDGKDIWCKEGKYSNKEIRIDKNRGWEYRSKEGVFVNERLGLIVEPDSTQCRER